MAREQRRPRAAMTVWMAYRGAWGFIATLSWTTAAVYFIRDVGMSPLQLVLAGTALEVAYFVFEIPTAVVADTYSRRTSVIIAAGLSGVAMVLIGLAPRVEIVILGMALWGVGWTFRSGAEDAWLADEIGPQRLGRAYQRSAQAARIAGMLGIATAVVLGLVDLRLPFIAAGVTAILLGFYLMAEMPERGFVRPGSPEVSAARDMTKNMQSTLKKGVHGIRSSPVLLLILVIFVFLGAFEEGFDRLWEAHLLLDVGLPGIGNLSAVVWFGVLNAATLVLSFALAAPLVDRMARLHRADLSRLLLGLHLALAGCALAFALAGSVWIAVVAYLATAVVRDLASPSVHTWLNEAITDSSARATVLSITSIAGSLGEWTGGPALGAIGSRWGVRTALAIAALLILRLWRSSLRPPVTRAPWARAPPTGRRTPRPIRRRTQTSPGPRAQFSRSGAMAPRIMPIRMPIRAGSWFPPGCWLTNQMSIACPMPTTTAISRLGGTSVRTAPAR